MFLMYKRVCFKGLFLILFLGAYALSSQLLTECELWSQRTFNQLWLEPTRVAVFFVLSILLGLFLRMPVTGRPKTDSLISGLVLSALTLIHAVIFFLPGIPRFWFASHYLFTLWLPVVAVCAGLAIATKLIKLFSTQ